MDKSLINTNIEQQFTEVVNLIVQHRSKASMAVNKEMLLTAWHVGAYVSKKLKSEEWGSKVISQLSEYIRSQHPEIKGYSRRNIYNMVMFYDEYSTETFTTIVNKYLDAEFVQPMAAQIEVKQLVSKSKAIQSKNGATAFVQPVAAQMPKILELTTFTNHIEILCRCKRYEQRLFYILYAHKEN